MVLSCCSIKVSFQNFSGYVPHDDVTKQFCIVLITIYVTNNEDIDQCSIMDFVNKRKPQTSCFTFSQKLSKFVISTAAHRLRRINCVG